jgi:GWxTD domain-containing protein
MSRPQLIRAALVAVSLAAAPAAFAAPPAEAAEALENPEPRWRTGPAKYLLGKDEARAYRKLKTEEERRAFIEEFWARRDPVPETEANEFRDQYARRLQQAEERFGPPNGRGWEEDRAKAVMLLGPPDTIEMREPRGGVSGPSSTPGSPGSPQAAAASPTLRRRAFFTYEREAYPGAPVPMQLEFLEDSYGGFRLVGSKPEFSHPLLIGLEPDPALVAAAAPPPEPEPPPPPPEPEPEPEPEPTAQEILMDEILGETAPESVLPVAARLDFYKTTDAETFVTVTLAVKKIEGSDEEPVLAARFVGLDETADSVNLEGEDSFSRWAEGDPTGTEDNLLFQAGHNVPPGEYSVAAAIKEPSTGNVGYVLQEITAPDFRDEALQLSTVTLARKVEPLTAAPEDPGARFVMGNTRIVPAPTGEFRPGQDLWIYYQVYNTANDPASGRPKLFLSYRFEKVEENRKIVLGGRPIEQPAFATVQAYAVPIQDAWPEGEYQVVVTVEDQVSGAKASATVPFKVVKDEA